MSHPTMKPALPLLVLSGAANLALLFLLTRDPAPAVLSPSSSAAGAAATPIPAATRDAGARASSSASDAPVSLETYRDRLLAAGLPADIVRGAIRAAIEEPRLSRQRIYYAEAARQPWWQGGLMRQNITPAQQRELTELQNKERAEILRVLGPDAYLTDAELERYAYLGPEKAAEVANRVRALTESSRALTGTGVERETASRQLTADHERALAALLTPEEFAAYQNRETTSVRNLSPQFAYFTPTDAEFQAMLVARQRLDAPILAVSTLLNADALQARRDATAAYNQTLADILGADRYALFFNSQRPEYRALVTLGERFQVPAAAIEQATRVQLDTLTEASRISSDTTLGPFGVKPALAALAERAREGIRAALGPDLAETYLTATNSQWLGTLDAGNPSSLLPRRASPP